MPQHSFSWGSSSLSRLSSVESTTQNCCHAQTVSLTGLILAATVLESQLPNKKGASLINAGGAPQPFPVGNLVSVL